MGLHTEISVKSDAAATGFALLPFLGDDHTHESGDHQSTVRRGIEWQQWNHALRDMLLETQQQEGNLAGTWDAKDRWEQQAGRIYSTSLRLLMLEVYYRHLPLYSIYGEP